MQNYDVFNGDADGICALLQRYFYDAERQQLRQTQLITGVKRDIALLQQIPTEDIKGSHITVLDISLDKNRAPLLHLLAQGANVFYADHHFAGEIPDHPHLDAHINTDANVCTSLIMNHIVEQSFYPWAVVGAYGDNLLQSAAALAKTHGIKEKHCQALQQLGTYINYNGYGATIEDLHIAPAILFQSLLHYPDPLDYIEDTHSDFGLLKQGFEQDSQQANETPVHYATDDIAVYILANAPWARRVSGVFGNQLANQFPERAHAVLTPTDAGYFVVSVRAPLNNKTGADELCRQFKSGGGRKAAAGINQLPQDDLALFIDRFQQQYAG